MKELLDDVQLLYQGRTLRPTKRLQRIIRLLIRHSEEIEKTTTCKIVLSCKGVKTVLEISRHYGIDLPESKGS